MPDLDAAHVGDIGQPVDQVQREACLREPGVEQPDADASVGADAGEPLIQAIIVRRGVIGIDHHDEVRARLLRMPGQLDGLVRTVMTGMGDDLAFSGSFADHGLDYLPPLGAGQGPEFAHHPRAEHAINGEVAGQPGHIAAQRREVQPAVRAERHGAGCPHAPETLTGGLLGLIRRIIHGHQRVLPAARVSASQSATKGRAL